MTTPKSEDETPLPPHRRSTGSVTQWGIIEAWLASGPLSTSTDARQTRQRLGVRGLEVAADDARTVLHWEPVRPDEDISQALVRAIGMLA